MLEEAGRSAGVPVAIAPALTDVGRLSRLVTLPVLGQHADAEPAGARTGYVPPEALRASGGRGSLVNHSERPLPSDQVGHVVARLKGLGLATVVCARDPVEAERLSGFRPHYLAVEPPELIGGSRSVSSARPEVISQTVSAVRRIAPDTHVLCGAGIHTREDVARAIELGSEGILVASAVTRSKDPAAAIAELLAGFP